MIHLITEENSELKGKRFFLPPGIKKYLLNIKNNYNGDQNVEGYKRICNILEMNGIEYREMKRLKNFFDNYNGNKNTDTYILNGGDILKNWVNKELGNATSAIKSYKETKRKMGNKNSFIKAHTNDKMSTRNESRMLKNVIITESQYHMLMESLLIEDQYSTKQGRRAISYMKKNGITDPNQQKKIIDALMNDLEIHHTDDPRFNYIVGCVRLYLSKELTDFESINSLKTILKYVSDNGHQGQYNETLNNLSLSELSDRFTALQQADSEQSRNSVNSLGYGDMSLNGYEIVKIENEEQCKEYGDYTSWCITHGSYSGYQLDGTNQCYFCLKSGFERLKRPKDTSKAPFDEYGLSMISVIVDYNGDPLYITTRYNHDYDGENNPELCTAEQVSKLIGVDFYKVFKPNEKGLELKKKMDRCKYYVDSNPLFVDLGLSVKWCNVNVNADSPSEYGGYFAWGETDEKNVYSEDNYDLDKPFEDVAQVRGLGRIPSIDEIEELLNNCEWLWSSYNGVNGYYVESKVNGNCIFLPAAGYRGDTSSNNVNFLGSYWSSTMDESNSYDAYYFYFNSNSKSTSIYNRNYGRTVRPVSE